MAVKYIDNGNDDGHIFGQASTEKIGFLGADPVVQQTLTSVINSTTMTSTSPYGFADQTQAEKFYLLVEQMKSVLETFGFAAEG